MEVKNTVAKIKMYGLWWYGYVSIVGPPRNRFSVSFI